MQSFPWLYPYQEDGPRLGSTVMRPVVPITLAAVETAPTSFALVDSGSEHILAAPWLAVAVGIDPLKSDKSMVLGIGGESVKTRFADLTIRLHPPGATDEDYIEWPAEVGFVEHWRPTWPIVLGQVGFIDRFTVTLQRQSQQLAVEDWDAFDQRFGIPLHE